MGRLTLVQMFTYGGYIVGGSIGVVVGLALDFYPYVFGIVFALLFGGGMMVWGEYLNEKGILYVVFQIVNLIFMLIPSYIITIIIGFSAIHLLTAYPESHHNLIALISLPLSIIVLLFYLKHKQFELKFMIDTGFDYEEVERKPKIKKSKKHINVNFKKVVLYFFLALITSMFLLYVYPTLYKYDKLEQKYPVKINRITGETYILNKNGWHKTE